jgi:hypothetical protein
MTMTMTTMSDGHKAARAVYVAWATLVIACTAWAVNRGGVFAPDKVTGVPKSVRNNPGSYRSVYVGGRIIRGK